MSRFLVSVKMLDVVEKADRDEDELSAVEVDATAEQGNTE